MGTELDLICRDLQAQPCSLVWLTSGAHLCTCRQRCVLSVRSWVTSCKAFLASRIERSTSSMEPPWVETKAPTCTGFNELTVELYELYKSYLSPHYADASLTITRQQSLDSLFVYSVLMSTLPSRWQFWLADSHDLLVDGIKTRTSWSWVNLAGS